MTLQARAQLAGMNANDPFVQGFHRRGTPYFGASPDDVGKRVSNYLTPILMNLLQGGGPRSSYA